MRLTAGEGTLLAPYYRECKDPVRKRSARLSAVRYRIETSAGQQAERYGIKRAWAKDLWHLCHRIIRAILSHTALAVDGANRHDKKLVEATLESIPVHRELPEAGEEQGLCLDKGYDYDDIRELVAEFAFTAHVRARGAEAQAIKRGRGTRRGGGCWGGRIAG